jgi:hypothetical protein
VFRPVAASELEILVNAFGDLSRAVNVNADANDEINVESGVRTTPTLVFFRSGEWVPTNLKAKWAHAQRFFPTNRMRLQPNVKLTFRTSGVRYAPPLQMAFGEA